MRIAIYGKNLKKENTETFRILVEELLKVGAKIFLHKNISEPAHAIGIQAELFSGHAEIKDRIDYLFSIGGDGTFLDTITLVRDSGIPIVGINTGRLGFLANIARDEIHTAVTDLVNKNYTLDKRSLIRLNTEAHLFGDINYALNELTVLKKDTSSMITINSYVDEKYLNSYWADGLILSTPTGSTAYSLSCGGPILTPDSENYILTPIAPHNLNVRPIVIPDKSKIRLTVEGRSEQFLVSLDSRTETIAPGTELYIEKCEFSINMVRFHFNTFLTTIRNKLMWGLDRRN